MWFFQETKFSFYIYLSVPDILVSFQFFQMSLLTRVCFWRAYCSLCLVGFSPSHPPASPPHIHVAPSLSSPSHLNWNTSSQRGLHWCPLIELPREHLKLSFLFLIILVIAAASVSGTGRQREYKNIVESYVIILCNGWGLDSASFPATGLQPPAGHHGLDTC